jgi:DNA replication protein DnaC
VLSAFKIMDIVSLQIDSKDSNLLILDDLGAELSDEKSRQIVLMLINGRYQHKLSTLINSNYELAELGNAYDGRVMSRIAKMCKIHHLRSVDRRIPN